jgi:glycosyltransferase involved in cell wall biosynthesis
MKQPSEGDPLSIIFTGSFDYRPNSLAVDFFLRKIFPLVRKAVPEAKFLAVGNGAGRRLAALRQVGFQAVDFVADLRNEIAKATVAVAPLTVGSGVSNKILESFATGTPIVATSIACGDLPLKDGVHLLVANEPERFATSVIALLQDAELRQRLTVPARRLVAENYDWEIVYRQMEQVFFSVVNRKQNSNVADTSIRTHSAAGA